MNISNATIDTAIQLKKELDAAYTVFKKKPTKANTSNWAITNQAFTDFCVKTVSDLIAEQTGGQTDKHEEILANLDKYKTCRTCGVQVLYPVTDTQYLTSDEFLQDFPGMCYSCLVKHCVSTECEECAVSAQPNCSFYEVKKLYLKNK